MPSERRRRSRVAVAVTLAVLVGCLAVLLASSPAPSARLGQGTAPPGALLPDLDPVAPGRLTVEGARSGSKRRWRLGFRSATENVGRGPLIVEGSRPSREQPTMTAAQTIAVAGGARSAVPNVGRLRFVQSSDHRHWHYLGFMRYELRRAATIGLVRPDRKTGFCLGDRYDPHRSEPAKPRNPVFEGDCDPNPAALSVTEGISVGYGDDYAAHLEGQYVDVTGLPSGRYLLVHRVNADAKLQELTHANNASSLLLRLSWPRGHGRRPAVRRLAACPASERCTRSPPSP